MESSLRHPARQVEKVRRTALRFLERRFGKETAITNGVQRRYKRTETLRTEVLMEVRDRRLHLWKLSPCFIEVIFVKSISVL